MNRFEDFNLEDLKAILKEFLDAGPEESKYDKEFIKELANEIGKREITESEAKRLRSIG